MKNIIRLLALTIAVISTGLAQAESVTFKNSYNSGLKLDHFIGQGKNYELLSIDYDTTGWESIQSASLSVKLSDDSYFVFGHELADLQTEFADIEYVGVNKPSLSTFTLFDGIPAEGVGFLGSLAEEWHFNVDVKTHLESTLGSIGKLWFLLHAEKGDFEYHQAKLDVQYTPSVSAVPIPAAALLFGPALLGFLGFRRKLKA